MSEARKPLSRAQRRMLREIKRWGELGPDAEEEVGVHGAAFEAVLAAVERKGLIRPVPGPVSGAMELTAAGHAALCPAA